MSSSVSNDTPYVEYHSGSESSVSPESLDYRWQSGKYHDSLRDPLQGRHDYADRTFADPFDPEKVVFSETKALCSVEVNEQSKYYPCELHKDESQGEDSVLFSRVENQDGAIGGEPFDKKFDFERPEDDGGEWHRVESPDSNSFMFPHDVRPEDGVSDTQPHWMGGYLEQYSQADMCSLDVESMLMPDERSMSPHDAKSSFNHPVFFSEIVKVEDEPIIAEIGLESDQSESLQKPGAIDPSLEFGAFEEETPIKKEQDISGEDLYEVKSTSDDSVPMSLQASGDEAMTSLMATFEHGSIAQVTGASSSEVVESEQGIPAISGHGPAFAKDNYTREQLIQMVKANNPILPRVHEKIGKQWGEFFDIKSIFGLCQPETLPYEKKIETGHGIWVIRDEVSKDDFSQCMAIVDKHIKVVRTSEKSIHEIKEDVEKSLIFMRESLSKVGVQKITFIPAALAEIFFVNLVVREDVARLHCLTPEKPVIEYGLNSWTALTIEGEQKAEVLSHKKPEMDGQEGVLRQKYRFNQALAEWLCHEGAVLTFGRIQELARENCLELQQFATEQGKELFAGYSPPGSIYKAIPYMPSILFVDDKRFDFVSCRICSKVDFQMIDNAIKIQCHEKAYGYIPLYRGGHLHRDDVVNDGGGAYALSYGASLFAGFIHDQKACSFNYMKLEYNDAYAVLHDNAFRKSPFRIDPEFDLMAQLFSAGEKFHGKTRVPQGMTADAGYYDPVSMTPSMFVDTDMSFLRYVFFDAMSRALLLKE